MIGRHGFSVPSSQVNPHGNGNVEPPRVMVKGCFGGDSQIDRQRKHSLWRHQADAGMSLLSVVLPENVQPVEHPKLGPSENPIQTVRAGAVPQA